MSREFFGLVECTACKGQGFTLGIFHRFTCCECLGSGYALARGGDGGPEVLTAALGRALTLARRELARRPVPVSGAAADYQGPAGSRTGD